MMHGVHPVIRKKKNYSTRTFGSTAVNYTPFSLDAGFGFPDQNADSEPEGCTWYTQNDLCQDEDKTAYDRHTIRDQTLSIEGQTDGPCDIDDSLVAAVFVHKMGQYFQLEKNPGMDWFDSAITTMRTTSRSLSVASPWFLSFEAPLQGVMPEIFPATWTAGTPGHNHKVYGVDLIDSQPVLIGKSWQGIHFGDAGKHYWTRKAFNALMDIPGSGAFTLAKWDGSIRTVQYGIIYRCQVVIRLLMRKLSYAALA